MNISLKRWRSDLLNLFIQRCPEFLATLGVLTVPLGAFLAAGALAIGLSRPIAQTSPPNIETWFLGSCVAATIQLAWWLRLKRRFVIADHFGKRRLGMELLDLASMVFGLALLAVSPFLLSLSLSSRVASSLSTEDLVRQTNEYQIGSSYPLLRPSAYNAHSDDADQSFRSHADQIGAKRRRALSV
jgi:hypothetical protein